jgi:hypothetical protein
VADDRLLLLPNENGEHGSLADPVGIHSMADITDEQRRHGYREILYTTDPDLAMGVMEGKPCDCEIRLGGRPFARGPAPPRGELHIPGWPTLAKIPADASGRLETARWIASAEHPLTARVMVNRVWQHLFGRGLARTVDDFGSTGEAPSHPELLDHLAMRFVQNGWSVKRLIRAIMLTRTYRLSSAGNAKTDPHNELYWRMNLRRLEVEPLRDAMLAASGRLTFERPTGIQVAGTGGKGRWGVTRSLLEIDAPYRTVYLPVLRSLLPEMHQTFDFPEPSQIQGQREVTTVAPQALFLLNSEFAADCARDAAGRLLGEPHATDEARVRAAYLRLLARPPSQRETDAALAFLENLRPTASAPDAELYRWAALTQALMATAEFRSVL